MEGSVAGWTELAVRHRDDAPSCEHGEMKMHAVPRKAPIGGKWSKEEDDKLKEIVRENGPKN